MKQTTLLAIIALLSLVGCYNGHPILSKPEYHIKIDCWEAGDNAFGNKNNGYAIYFTNDNYATSSALITDRYSDGELVYAPWDIHGDDTLSLVSFARKFKTYEQCIRYNDSVQKDFDSMSPPAPKLQTDTANCCKPKQIY